MTNYEGKTINATFSDYGAIFTNKATGKSFAVEAEDFAAFVRNILIDEVDKMNTSNTEEK